MALDPQQLPSTDPKDTTQVAQPTPPSSPPATSPAGAMGQGQTPSQAAQVMSPAAKQGRGQGTYTSVRGNIHMPQTATPESAPTLNLETPGQSATEESRARTKQAYQENELRNKNLTDAISNIQNDSKLTGISSAIAQGVARHAMDYALDSTNVTGVLHDLETTTGVPGAHADASGNLIDANNKPIQQVDPVTNKPQYTDASGNVTTESTHRDATGNDVPNTAIMVKAPVTGTAISAMLSPTAERDHPGITALMTQLDTASGTAVNDIIGQIAVMLHGATALGATTLTMSDLATLGLDTAATTAHILSSGMAHAVRIDATLMKEIGWDDKAALQTALNLLGFTDPNNPPTLEEYQAAVKTHLETDAKPISDMMSTVNDPFASASEREDALGNLRDMGYTGTLANAADLKRLSDAVEAAGTNITVGGKTFATMKDLLSDKTMTGLVGGYLNGTVDRADLPSSLADLIDKNYNVFEDIATEHKTETDNFTAVQKAGAAAMSGLEGFGDDILSTIFSNYKPGMKFFDEALKTSGNTGVLGIIGNPDASAGDRAAAVKMITDLQASMGADLFKSYITKMSDADFKKLSDSNTLTQFKNGITLGANVDKAQALISPTGSDGSPTDSGKLDGRSTNPADIEKVLVTALPELETVGGAGLSDTINALAAVPTTSPEYEAAQAAIHAISHYFESGVTVADAIKGLHVLMDAAKVGSVDGASKLTSGIGDLKAAIIKGVQEGQAELMRVQAESTEYVKDKQALVSGGYGETGMDGLTPVPETGSLDDILDASKFNAASQLQSAMKAESWAFGADAINDRLIGNHNIALQYADRIKRLQNLRPGFSKSGQADLDKTIAKLESARSRIEEVNNEISTQGYSRIMGVTPARSPKK